jgi:hypothetical protein
MFQKLNSKYPKVGNDENPNMHQERKKEMEMGE